MLLDIKNLTVGLKNSNQGRKIIVDDINLSIEQQSIVGLVGGSGSGKTTTGLSILRLLAPQLEILNGQIMLNETNLLELPETKMRKTRGKIVSMVFQEPLNALNPVFTIGYQVAEVLKCHTDLSDVDIKDRAMELLDIVGIEDPVKTAQDYPHQLSGGMRQRAMIAQAIAVNPKLIIADEPTSNLDVTLQARIIELFKRLRDELHLSILLITHDLGVVEHMADYVSVMSKGKIIEFGKTMEVLKNPKELYTRQLMEALNV